MRRSDREITDVKAIEAFIAKEQIMRIAFYDNGEIYIVPVNYGYTNDSGQYAFYFHGAKAGRKYELSKESPNIGFEIDGNYELLEADIACDFSAKFQSVVGTGKISIVEYLATNTFPSLFGSSRTKSLMLFCNSEISKYASTSDCPAMHSSNSSSTIATNFKCTGFMGGIMFHACNKASFRHSSESSLF